MTRQGVEDGMNDDRTGSVTYCYYEEYGMNDDRTGSVTYC